MSATNSRTRPAASEGNVSKLHGEYRLSQSTGLLTLANAATATAGHVFVMRYVPAATTKRALIRYVAIDWNMTTAFGTAQLMGFDLINMTASTVVYTGGTAIDCGSTDTTVCQVRQDQTGSAFTANSVRIATTGDLTAGTQTLAANALASAYKWQSATLGTGPGATASLQADLWDARDDGFGSCRSPLELATGEGFVIRNRILMGASGVGILGVTVWWDEVTP